MSAGSRIVVDRWLTQVNPTAWGAASWAADSSVARLTEFLESIPTLIGRLALIASLRETMASHQPGQPGPFHYQQSAIGSFLRRAHRDLLVEWLSAPLETRARDFRCFLRVLDREDKQRIGQMLRLGDYSALLPADLEPMHRNHFAIEVGALLPLLSIEILSMPVEGNSFAPQARFS